MSTESFEECATAGLAEVRHEEDASHSSNGYCPYCYDQVEDWISSARSYVCDVSNGMNSKATNHALLLKALELLDLLKQAFKDSKDVLNSPTFRINVEKNHSVIRDILNACPDEKLLDVEDAQELAAAKAGMAINVEKNHSVIRDILNACPDEKLLDAEDAQELAAAKAGMAIAEARLGDKSKYANIPNMQ